MKTLHSAHNFDLRKVAALTPYSAQKDEIKREMKEERIDGPQVKTITESQGAIHLIFSTCNNNYACMVLWFYQLVHW